MTLVYLTAKRFPAPTADHHYIEALARAFARALDGRFLLAVGGAAPGALAGIPLQDLGAPRSFRTLWYFFALPRLLREWRRGGEPVAVFSNDLNLLSVLAFWRPFLGHRYRICSDWHLIPDTAAAAFVARRSDALVTTSARLKQCIVERTGVPEARIHVVYGGVDTAAYAGPAPDRRALGLPDGFLAGYVGLFRTMGKEKGLDTMLEALRFLPQDARMAFVGGTPEEIDRYRERARDLGVLERTVWVERQPPGRVADYQRALDALVIPYPDEPHFRDHGFPMKAYEYLASGKPIVFSDLAILGEVLGSVGVPFRAGDPADLARAIERTRTAPTTPVAVPDYDWDAKARSIGALATGPEPN